MSCRFKSCYYELRGRQCDDTTRFDCCYASGNQVHITNTQKSIWKALLIHVKQLDDKFFQVFVMHPCIDTTVAINVKPNMTVQMFAKIIERQMGLDPGMRYYLRIKHLHHILSPTYEKRLSGYGIKRHSNIIVWISPYPRCWLGDPNKNTCLNKTNNNTLH